MGTLKGCLYGPHTLVQPRRFTTYDYALALLQIAIAHVIYSFGTRPCAGVLDSLEAAKCSMRSQVTWDSSVAAWLFGFG